MFRNLRVDEKMKDSEIGKKVASLIDAGNFVPDDLTADLFFKSLEEYASKKIFNPESQILILDGIPRNANQTALIKDKIEVINIIYLFSSNDNALAERLAKRAELEGRNDDRDPNIIRKRLEIYKRDTEAVLKCYPKDIILDIDALPPIEEIYKNITSKLKI
jgi:adenylate kinase